MRLMKPYHVGSHGEVNDDSHHAQFPGAFCMTFKARWNLGVKQWGHKDHYWWIVTLPCAGHQHDQRIVDWCHEQFGYVDKGVLLSGLSQEFWFDSHEEAFNCWLTWGTN